MQIHMSGEREILRKRRKVTSRVDARPAAERASVFLISVFANALVYLPARETMQGILVASLSIALDLMTFIMSAGLTPTAFRHRGVDRPHHSKTLVTEFLSHLIFKYTFYYIANISVSLFSPRLRFLSVSSEEGATHDTVRKSCELPFVASRFRYLNIPFPCFLSFLLDEFYQAS